MGRNKGSRNKGYFFRTGRGWYVNEVARKVPLRDEAGNHLKDPQTHQTVLREAYARHIVASPVAIVAQADSITVAQVCETYLDQCEAVDAVATLEMRRNTLYDFCTGLPPRMRGKEAQTPRADLDAARIHKGYGALSVADLKPIHVDKWLQDHPAWQGSKRTKVQALKRALNYCVSAGVIDRNPIKGYKAAKANMRKTYITPEQEQALCKAAKPAFALALKVCIRTGARYGCEFARLTAAHVKISDDGARMEWRFSAKESKTKKERIIRVTDPEIIATVREQIEQHPKGPIFRNTRGDAWTKVGLSGAFTRLRQKLETKGVKFDADACMYSARHTFAKRVLSGYWTGKPTTIEHLAALMGNTREVCWSHYSQWCDSYTEPLWASI